MSPIAKFALLAVVFVDLIGQGPRLPDHQRTGDGSETGLPAGLPSDATRHFDYGLVIGIFFLSWFFGGVYVAKISDTIGRKNAIMICLFGALVGYLVTIASLFADSLWLLILGRAITGFTAGNQPIAQAAMIDGSPRRRGKGEEHGFHCRRHQRRPGRRPDHWRPPVRQGDPRRPGQHPAALLLRRAAGGPDHPAGAVFLPRCARDPGQAGIQALEVFTQLVRIREKPVVMRLWWVYLCFMTANVTFYIFMDNYLTSRFQIGLLGTSMAMMVLGIALATSSTFFVDSTLGRFGKLPVISVVTMVMALSAIGFIVTPLPVLCYAFVATYYFGFGLAYPALLGIFSASVSDAEQGWIMGVTTAGFTLAAGIFSLIGGVMMAVDIRLPFYVCLVAALGALLLMRLTWRHPDIEAITR